MVAKARHCGHIAASIVIGVGGLWGVSACSSQAGPSTPPSSTAPMVVASPVAIPPDWPKQMPMPSGLTPVGFTKLGGQPGGGLGFVGRFEGPGDVGQVSAELESAFESAGFQTRATTADPAGTQKWLKPDQLAELKITGDGGIVRVQETILVTSAVKN